MPSLTTKVYVANKDGVKEESTVRDVITLARGKAFETLKALDCFESLVAQLEEEKEKPIEVLTENLRLARKNMEKARWWVTTGVYFRTPTEDEVNEAENDNRVASYKYHDAYYALSVAENKNY